MTTTKKVLFISYDGMTDPLGQSQVIPYLQGLSKAGFRIFLLSCEKKQMVEQNKAAIQKLLDESNITWVPLNYTKNPPVFSTLLDIFKLKKAAKKIHREQGLDMVHTRPGVPALVGLWMKKTLGVKFLNDIREFYADSRVEGGMWNTRLPVYASIYNYFKRKEAEAVAKNDGIVCLTYAAEHIIKEWPEYKTTIPLQVIPCSADMELFDPASISADDREVLRSELQISKDDLVISYLGSIGGWYLTDELMQFCKMLSDKIPATKLLFISPHRHEEIKMAAAKYGIAADKLIIKKAGRQQVPLSLSLSDYSVFFIKPCYSKQSSSPTKHGEIMAMGIPVIANSGVGDVKEIIEKYNAGFVLDSFGEREMENIIDKMANSKTVFDAHMIRQGAIEFYDLEKSVSAYVQVYKKILG